MLESVRTFESGVGGGAVQPSAASSSSIPPSPAGAACGDRTLRRGRAGVSHDEPRVAPGWRGPLRPASRVQGPLPVKRPRRLRRAGRSSGQRKHGSMRCRAPTASRSCSTKRRRSNELDASGSARSLDSSAASSPTSCRVRGTDSSPNAANLAEQAYSYVHFAARLRAFSAGRAPAALRLRAP